MDLRAPSFNVRDGAINWAKFIQSFKIYVEAVGLTDAEEKHKCNLLLHCMGPEGLDLYNTFELKAKEVNNFDVLVEKFNNYCQMGVYGTAG